MVCAAGHTLKAKGGKSTPERWLVFSVCPKAHACSKNHFHIVAHMEPLISPSTSIMVDGEIDGSMYGTIYE